MAKHVTIRKGLDVPIKGKPEKQVEELQPPEIFALKPTDFHGVRPKVIAKPGTKVKVGSVVYHNKFHPEVKFTSPVSGEVTEIVRGEKRKILEIRIKSDGAFDAEAVDIPDPAAADEAAIKEVLLTSGLWPLIVQRPFGVIPAPDDKPDAVFVSLFNSAPMAADLDFVLKDQLEDLKMGAEIIHKLTGKSIHFGLSNASDASMYKHLPHAEFNTFKGPHPAGNVGTQMNKIRPINKGEKFWTLKAQDLALIGRYFRTKELNPSRIVAFTGSELKKRFYASVLPGASLKSVIDKHKTQDNIRIISGDVLTGKKLTENAFISFQHDMLSVIPEGDYYEFFGWAKPGFDKFSVSKTYFSWLFPGKKYRLDTNYHGGPRAYVVTGEYEKVCPIDIYPQQLVKACLIQDIDKMEELGIYEVIEEDMALCEFVCTSKTEVQKILREALDMLREELS